MPVAVSFAPGWILARMGYVVRVTFDQLDRAISRVNLEDPQSPYEWAAMLVPEASGHWDLTSIGFEEGQVSGLDCPAYFRHVLGIFEDDNKAHSVVYRFSVFMNRTNFRWSPRQSYRLPTGSLTTKARRCAWS